MAGLRRGQGLTAGDGHLLKASLPALVLTAAVDHPCLMVKQSNNFFLYYGTSETPVCLKIGFVADRNPRD